jgi:hypothetical protein
VIIPQFVVDMTEVIGRQKPSRGFLLKLLIVLLIPLNGHFSDSSIGWSSILLRVGGGPLISFTSINSIIVSLLIMSPCLIFERQLNSKPISDSIRRKATAACILSWFISFLLPFLVGLLGMTSLLYNAIMHTFVLSIAFFVILPLINREATMRSISKERHSLSYQFITAVLSKKFRREKILSGLLWLGLVFCPFIFYPQGSFWYTKYIMVSLFYIFTSIGWPPPPYIYDPMRFGMELQLAATMFDVFPYIALLSGIRFLFVRDVFRYQTGRVTKSRLTSIALLGEILPSAVMILIPLLLTPSGGYILLLYPIPFLPILGFIFIRFSKVIPVKYELWPDYEHRMWFEKDRKPFVPQSDDESIKVPLGYLLVSRIRMRLKEQ